MVLPSDWPSPHTQAEGSTGAVKTLLDLLHQRCCRRSRNTQGLRTVDMKGRSDESPGHFFPFTVLFTKAVDHKAQLSVCSTQLHLLALIH